MDRDATPRTPFQPDPNEDPGKATAPSSPEGESDTGVISWEHVEPLLDELLDLDSSSQSAYLNRLSRQDQALAERLLELLAKDEPDQLLREELNPLMDQALDALDQSEIVRGRVGAWEIEEEIGRGGMGRVYRAVRADGQYQQSVALKVMGERLGDRLARHRFLNERQILARLSHPNVARLVDGGVLDDGRPYFAMELVEGSPLLAFADQKRLPIRERIELLIQLCSGIEYAHRNLIIHRDIKPSNILVTETTFSGDGEGTLRLVKLLDFGIAKMTDRDGTTTLQTLGDFRPMTFEYASPEQLRGDDVTTSSDLYSLGLVSFELLAGLPPFDTKSESLSSVARVADTSNPAPFASQRVGSLSAAEIDALAEVRSTSARQLQRALRNELDDILAKCLRKRPEHRYDSVVELRRDLERHLEGLPVRATRGGTRYRIRKWFARNRLAAVAGTVGAMALAVGLAGVLLQARATVEQRDRAVAAEQRANTVNRFLLDEVLGAAGPERARGRTLTVTEALDESAAALAGQVVEDPVLDAELRGVVGNLYLELGRADEAAELIQQALATTRTLGAPDAEGRALSRLGRFELATGDPSEARIHLEEARDLLAREVGPDALDTLVAETLLAQAESLDGDRGAALERQQSVLARLDRHHPTAWRERLAVMSDLTGTLAELRDAGRAEQLALETLRLQRERLGADHPDLVPTLRRLAAAQLRDERPREALANLEQAFELQRKLIGPDGADSASLVQMARSLVATQRTLGLYDEAIAFAEETLELARELEGPQGLLGATMLNALGVLHTTVGRQEDASREYLQAARELESVVGPYHPSTLRALRNHASSWQARYEVDAAADRDGYRQAKDLLLDTEAAAAEAGPDPTLLADIANDFVWQSRGPEDLRTALDLAQRAVEASERRNWEALQSLGRAQAALGQYEEALETNLEALEFTGALTSRALQEDTVEAFHALDRSEEAEGFLESLLARRSEERGENDWSVAVGHLGLARWGRDHGGVETAESHFREAVRVFRAAARPDNFRLLVTTSEFGSFLLDQGRLDEAEKHITSAFDEMLGRPYIPRRHQIDITEAMIALQRAQGRRAEADSLAMRLEVWRRQPVHSAWT